MNTFNAELKHFFINSYVTFGRKGRKVNTLNTFYLELHEPQITASDSVCAQSLYPDLKIFINLVN